MALSDTKKKAAREMVLAALGNKGRDGARFSELFLIARRSIDPSELKLLLFEMQLAGEVEEIVPTLFRLADRKPPPKEKEPEKPTFKCRICGLTYADEKWWKKCELWCATHPACNLQIGQHSLEGRGEKESDLEH